MKRRFILALLAIFILISACSQENQNKISDLKITHLRCEYLKNPLGIDVVQPRLSWVMGSSERGLKQTAYRIIVSSSEEILQKNTGDLWDSGKVKSDLTNQIVYEGKNLHSRMKCYWKVHVWDNNRSMWESSGNGFWTMGLLNEEDWKGSWIAMELIPRFLKPLVTSKF